MIYDDRAYMRSVTPAEAAKIRRKIYDNMDGFLGHRELPLNENTVQEASREWTEMILSNPEHYGEALVEMAEFRKRYRDEHGESRHINTPSRKLVQIMAREGKI